MKDNPELVTASASFIGSLAKAVRAKLSWRKTVASVLIATLIGYLMPNLIDYFFEGANRQMIIAISILVGFSMHGLLDLAEEYLKEKAKKMVDK